MLKIHHLNCGSMCPIGGSLMDGHSHGLHAYMVNHCLAIETQMGIVLVDTGLGTLDILTPQKRISGIYGKLLNLQLELKETAIGQLQALGFNSDDVTHIVLTHLDFDHAGGITDFPKARVHVLRSEVEAAMGPVTWIGKNRYRQTQWNLQRNWETYERGGENWFDFKCVRDLKGLPPEILMVPLAGHTLGHCGVAIDTGQQWLLHAGDAYFHHREIETENYCCPLGLRLFQRLMEEDHDLRIMNQARLRSLKKNYGGKIKIFSSHDAVEFDYWKKESAIMNQSITFNRLDETHRFLH